MSQHDSYVCPDCRTALRVRPGAVLRDVECPECGLPLHLDRDVDGVLTVSARRRPVPEAERGGWPLRVGAGVAVAGAVLLAGWLVVRGGPGDQFPVNPPERPAARFAPVPPPPAPEPDPPGPAPPPVPAGGPAVAPPTIAAGRATPRGEVPAPTADPAIDPAVDPPRVPVEAVRPSTDHAAARFARRLGQPIRRYATGGAVPLDAVTADLESLLGVRVAVAAGHAGRPVRVEAEGVTAGELLAAVADAAGLRAVVEDGRVRLEPSDLKQGAGGAVPGATR